MKTVIIHQGINDISENDDHDQICENLQINLKNIKRIYKNARIIYSEILSNETNPWSDDIEDVNSTMSNFCYQNNFIYCSHRAHRFKPEWFLDHKHINGSSGTKVFVSDLLKAGRTAKSNPWNQRSFSRSSSHSRQENENPQEEKTILNQRNNSNVNNSKNDEINNDQIIKLYTLKMMKAFH